MTFLLPSWYCWTWSAQRPRTSSTMGSRAPVSVTWRSPRSSTTRSGSSSVPLTASSTSRACAKVMASSARSAEMLLTCVGLRAS